MAAEPTTESTETEALRARIDAPRARAARAHGARERGARRGPGPELLARALEHRPERAHAAPRRRRARARRCGRCASVYRLRHPIQGFFRTLGTRVSIARQAVDEERALGAGAVRRPGVAHALPRPAAARPGHRPSLRAARARRRGGGRAAARRRPIGAVGDGRAARPAAPDARFAAHYELDGALERTGLSAAMPDAGVHSMAHGARGRGRLDLLRRPRRRRARGERASSSSRAGAARLRLLVGTRGARARGGAIRRSSGTAATRSPTRSSGRGRTCRGSGSSAAPSTRRCRTTTRQFDAAFAISIWSHFAEEAALDWLREMRRVIRPGGRLLAHHPRRADDRAHRERGRPLGGAARRGARARSHATASGTPPSSARRATTAWRTPTGARPSSQPSGCWPSSPPSGASLLFRPGRVELNQDLYVLERV